MAGKGDFAGARMALIPTTLDDGTTGYKLQVDSSGASTSAAPGSNSTQATGVQGVDNGKPVAVQTPIPATIVTGQVALTANTRAQLASNAMVNGIVVKSDPANTAKVLIGGSGVTVAADGTGTGYILAPGEAVSFAVSNTNAIYAISTAAAVLSFEGN